MLVRVSKLLAQRGWCSRREADEYIRQGLVAVNGEILSTLGTKVDMNTAQVELLPQAMTQQMEKVTIVLNKPLGMVSCQPDINSRYDPAIQLLMRENYWGQRDHSTSLTSSPTPRYLSKLGVCGRLDVNSSGLLLFTQDGVLAKHIIQAHSKIEKEYLVRVSTLLCPPRQAGSQGHHHHLQPSRHISAILDQLHEGMWCDGTGILNAHHHDGSRRRPSEPDFLTAKSIEIVNENQLRFVLTEGKQRHIRRMCAKVGLDVVALKRVRIGQLALGPLPLRQWRYYDPTTEAI